MVTNIPIPGFSGDGRIPEPSGDRRMTRRLVEIGAETRIYTPPLIPQMGDKLIPRHPVDEACLLRR